jgi:hypothetical protein
MSSQGTEVAQLFRSFEDCRFEFEGTEAWRARELMPLLGYARWENFREALRRAWQSCKAAGLDPSANFVTGALWSGWDPDEVFRDITKNRKGDARART